MGGKSIIEEFEKKIQKKGVSKNESSPCTDKKSKSKEILQTTPKKPAKKEKTKKMKEEEYMIEMLVKREGNKYLVKWENFPMAQNTWEPRSSIPQFILEYYESDPTRLGTAAPTEPIEEGEEEEEEYEVDAILKKRIKKGKVEYFVRWKYYNDTTWEPEENLQNVLQMIDDFEKKESSMVTKEKKTEKPEVEKILEKRNKKGMAEYLVKWKNQDEPGWVSQSNLETAKQKIQEYENSLTSEQEYEIEKILEKRVHKGKLQYFVKWKNFDETTWEPLSHLKDVRDMIDEFEKKQIQDEVLAITGEGSRANNGRKVEYEVEKVLEKRFRKGRVEYFVKWKYYNETTWEPSCNLTNVQDLIDNFERKKPESPKKQTPAKEEKKKTEKAEENNFEVEYEVEKVLEKRFRKGRVEYFVKWKNYDETTWEPSKNLTNVQDLIEKFEKAQS